MPEISASACSSRQQSSSMPCAVATGWSGWIRAKPGSRATDSLIFGLYFIVQEPSG